MSEVNIVYTIGAIALILFVWIIVLEFRIKRLLRGKTGDNLEDLIRKTNKDLEGLMRSREEIRKDIAEIRDRIRHHVRGIKTVRFNPFKDSGSNQSFATAFLSDEGDGVVISSLYSRDRVGIYAKPLKDHKSEYELSDEERRAVMEARNHQ